MGLRKLSAHPWVAGCSAAKTPLMLLSNFQRGWAAPLAFSVRALPQDFIKCKTEIFSAWERHLEFSSTFPNRIWVGSIQAHSANKHKAHRTSAKINGCRPTVICDECHLVDRDRLIFCSGQAEPKAFMWLTGFPSSIASCTHETAFRRLIQKPCLVSDCYAANKCDLETNNYFDYLSIHGFTWSYSVRPQNLLQQRAPTFDALVN